MRLKGDWQSMLEQVDLYQKPQNTRSMSSDAEGGWKVKEDAVSDRSQLKHKLCLRWTFHDGFKGLLLLNKSWKKMKRALANASAKEWHIIRHLAIIPAGQVYQPVKARTTASHFSSQPIDDKWFDYYKFLAQLSGIAGLSLSIYASNYKQKNYGWWL